MKNRKLPYGYRIANGEIALHPEEAPVAQRVFSLYLHGMAYQKIADALESEGIPYDGDGGAWNKHKVKRLLENPKYTGCGAFPALVGNEPFQAVQDLIASKTADCAVREKRPEDSLWTYLHCTGCGKEVLRICGPDSKGVTPLRCRGCGAKFHLRQAELAEEAFRQLASRPRSQAENGALSEEAVRLNNAINRGLERPEDPEQLRALILQAVSARYQCYAGEQFEQENTRRLSQRDWTLFARAVSHINIGKNNAVEVLFR